jgi:SpoVK/Ycf46/Vps4 family AAA+-type ATPase
VRDVDVNLYGYERLRTQFGPFTEDSDHRIPGWVEHELVGEQYRRVLSETSKIVAHQWKEKLQRSALKGFLLYGGVGVGKTTMGKRLAYEMCRVFGDSGHDSSREDEVVLIVIDGADIARGRYGESEEKLRELFEYARQGEVGYSGHGHRHDDDPTRRTVMLFDDVESLFLTRSSGGAKEWHFSQNSVFFHSIDELDTSRTAVVLTTNRIDLLDEAIVDRFMAYEFGVPSPDVLEEVARDKARLQHLSDPELAPILQEIRTPGRIKSIREVERLITRKYVEKVLAD